MEEIKLPVDGNLITETVQKLRVSLKAVPHQNQTVVLTCNKTDVIDNDGILFLIQLREWTNAGKNSCIIENLHSDLVRIIDCLGLNDAIKCRRGA